MSNTVNSNLASSIAKHKKKNSMNDEEFQLVIRIVVD